MAAPIHSPAPWRWREVGGDLFVENGDSVIVEIPTNARIEDRDRADARLIAASPDLLAAAKAFRHVAVWDDDQTDRAEFEAAAAALDAEIAKAEGRAP